MPWQVSIRRFGRHICGGAIIGEKAVLSAAHCVQSGQESIMRVHFGTTRRSKHSPRRNVHKIIHHEEFQRKVLVNDIALIIVQKNFVFNDRVQAVALPSFDIALPANESVFVSGWGIQTPGTEDLPKKLQGLDVKIVDQQVCVEAYRAIPKMPPITENMLCAGQFNVSGHDACKVSYLFFCDIFKHIFEFIFSG